jgi:hypothetical protein
MFHDELSFLESICAILSRYRAWHVRRCSSVSAPITGFEHICSLSRRPSKFISSCMIPFLRASHKCGLVAKSFMGIVEHVVGRCDSVKWRE